MFSLYLHIHCNSAMSNNLKIFKNFLMFLLNSNASDQQIKSVLQRVTQSQVKVICEIFHNFLAGVLPLKKEKIKKLAVYKNLIRKLADKKSSKNICLNLIRKNSGKIFKTLIYLRDSLKSILH